MLVSVEMWLGGFAKKPPPGWEAHPPPLGCRGGRVVLWQVEEPSGSGQKFWQGVCGELEREGGAPGEQEGFQRDAVVKVLELGSVLSRALVFPLNSELKRVLKKCFARLFVWSFPFPACRLSRVLPCLPLPGVKAAAFGSKSFASFHFFFSSQTLYCAFSKQGQQVSGFSL